MRHKAAKARRAVLRLADVELAPFQLGAWRVEGITPTMENQMEKKIGVILGIGL